MLKFLPATSDDIRIGETVRVRHDDRKKPTVQGKVVERRRGSAGTLYFSIAREIDSVTEYFRLDDWSPFSVAILRDTDKAIANFMRRLRYRWSAVDPLKTDVLLVDGPLAGLHFNPRSHDATLVIECNGQRGRYERLNAQTYVWRAT